MSHTTLSRRQTLMRLGTLALGSNLLLTGCSAEPKERKAFIAFLQTEVLGKSRRSMPLLNERMRKKLGGYAAHYEVITNFNQAANEKAMTKNMRELQGVSSLAGYRDKRETVKQALLEIPQAQASMTAELTKADAAKAAMKHPEDLKKVYDTVYDRLVSTQARIMFEVLPTMQRMLTVVMDLLSLVEKNPQQLSISGIQIEAKSQAMLDKVNALYTRADAETATLERLEKELKQLLG